MSQNRRFVVVIALSALTAGVLSACGGGADSAGDGSTTVTFWTHTHPPMIEVYNDLIAQYEEANPGATIDYQTIPNNEFGTKMLTSLSNGSGPCVINMDDTALRGEYILKDLLAPVDPEAFGLGSVDELESRYVDGTLDGAKGEDGTLYGLPSEYNATAFAINKQHFEDAGLDPAQPPATWGDVAEMGQKLIAAGHEQAFSFLYLHAGWYSQQLQTLLNQTGGAIVEDGKGTLDNPAAIEALQLWVDLAGGSKSTADPNKTSREATLPFQDLATGEQSMAILYPWSMDQIAETNPDTYANLELVPLPQLDPANPVNRSYAYYWAVNKDCPEPEAAWTFIDFLSQHTEEFLSGTSFVQPVVGWDETPAAQDIPFIDVWADAYGQGTFDEITSNNAEVQDAIMTMVNSAVFDGVPVDDAAREATESISRILGN